MNRPSQRPCNYKPAGFQAESTGSALIPDYADVSANSSLRLRLADPNKPRLICCWVLRPGGRGQPDTQAAQSPVGPVHMPVEAAGGPQPVGASLQSLPPSPRGISASGSVSHVLGGRRPCGGNSGGHCPRLSTFQPSRPAAGDRDRLPRQDVSSGPDAPREEWVALLRSSGVGAAVVQG